MEITPEIEKCIKVLKPLCSRYKHVKLEDCLGIIEKESEFKPELNCKSLFYLKRLVLAMEMTRLSMDDVEVALEVKESNKSKYAPVFRFEDRNWDWAKKQIQFYLTQRFLLSCSFGVAQKSMREYTKNYPEKEWIKSIRAFRYDQNKQFETLCNDLERALIKTKNDRLLAYSYYNNGKLEATEYGKVVEGFVHQWKFKLKGI